MSGAPPAPAGPTGFEPRIIAFLCNWCSYAGADLAGGSRFQYPTNLRTVRVMCSGRVDPEHVLKAFLKGADGVLIGGCHIGDCHYRTGNFQTESRMEVFGPALRRAGIEPGRMRLEWISGSEGEKFARVATEFTATVKALGPLRLDEGKRASLEALGEVARDLRTRWLIGRMHGVGTAGNVYGEKVDRARWRELVEREMDQRLRFATILSRIRTQGKTALEISAETGLAPRDVLRDLVEMTRRKMAERVEEHDQDPRFREVPSHA